MADDGVALARRLFMHVKDGGSVSVMEMSRLVMAMESIQTQRDMAQGERMRLAGELSSASSSLTAWMKKASMLEAESSALQSALLRCVQYDNKCDQTGRSCREDEPCACQKEAETWLEDK